VNVTAKRVSRALVVLLLVLLVGYLAVLGTANPQTIDLLFFIPLPTAWVIAVALLLGFAVGALSLLGRVFRLKRENRRLRQYLIRSGLAVEAPGLETPAPAKRGRSA
jgi:uncharacterized integral membrane protein